jgi:hypothetical protein
MSCNINLGDKKVLITSSDVSSRERDYELFRLCAFEFGLGDDVLVQALDGPLEAGELGHGVGDLATPQWTDRFVEPAQTFFSPEK